MSVNPISTAGAKASARELQVMLRRSGVPAGLMSCQQAVARMMGHSSWHAFKKQAGSGAPAGRADGGAPADHYKQGGMLCEMFDLDEEFAVQLSGYLDVFGRDRRVVKACSAEDARSASQRLVLPSLEAFQDRFFDPLDLMRVLPKHSDIGMAGAVVDDPFFLSDEFPAPMPELILTRDVEAWRAYSRKLEGAWGGEEGLGAEHLSFLSETSGFDPFLVSDPLTGSIIGGVAVARYASGARLPGHHGMSWLNDEPVRNDGDGETHASLVHEHCRCHLLPGYGFYARGMGMLFGALMAQEMAWLACSRRPRIYRVTPEIGETFTASNATVDDDFLLGMMDVVDQMKDEGSIWMRFPWCHFDQLVPDGFEDEWPLDEDVDP